MKAILIKPVILGWIDGCPMVTEEVTEVRPQAKDFTLSEIRKLLECDMVEHVGLVNDVDLWTDEEGRMKEAPLANLKATQYFHKAFPKDKFDWTPFGGPYNIVGNALIINNTKAGWL